MESSSSSTAAAQSFEDTCEVYGVDSRLLYNDIEQLSNKRSQYARRLVSWSRLLALAAVAAAGVAGGAAYYQRAQIYQVWGLRNPHRVRQLSLLTMVSGSFSLCTFLFLISPVGLMRLHDKEVHRTWELDAIAVAALVQEQNFRTLAAWGRAGMRTQCTQEEKTESHEPAEMSPRGSPADPLLGMAGQWVWREVVLDPTPLLSKQKAHSKDKDKGDAANTTKQKDGQASAGSEHEKKEGGDPAIGADVDTAKKRLSSDLLLTTSPPSFAEDKAGVEGEQDKSESSFRETQVAQRRVWTRTTDKAQLQAILLETVQMWESLVKAKTDILSRVFWSLFERLETALLVFFFPLAIIVVFVCIFLV